MIFRPPTQSWLVSALDETDPLKTNVLPHNSLLLCVDGDDSDGATIQSVKEMQKLKKKLKEYEEQNNLLKYKIELLLDMVRLFPNFLTSEKGPSKLIG